MAYTKSRGFKSTKKRRELPQRSSERMFSATADRVHRLNGLDRPMRGGIRL